MITPIHNPLQSTIKPESSFIRQSNPILTSSSGKPAFRGARPQDKAAHLLSWAKPAVLMVTGGLLTLLTAFGINQGRAASTLNLNSPFPERETRYEANTPDYMDNNPFVIFDSEVNGSPVQPSDIFSDTTSTSTAPQTVVTQTVTEQPVTAPAPVTLEEPVAAESEQAVTAQEAAVLSTSAQGPSAEPPDLGTAPLQNPSSQTASVSATKTDIGLVTQPYISTDTQSETSAKPTTATADKAAANSQAQTPSVLNPLPLPELKLEVTAPTVGLMNTAPPITASTVIVKTNTVGSTLSPQDQQLMNDLIQDMKEE